LRKLFLFLSSSLSSFFLPFSFCILICFTFLYHPYPSSFLPLLLLRFLPSVLPLLSAKTVYLISLKACHYRRITLKSTNHASHYIISMFSPRTASSMRERKLTFTHWIF
jgi:hypothetical protein